MSSFVVFLLILASIAWIIFSATRLGWHPFFSLLTASAGLGLLAGLPAHTLPATLGAGFGQTLSHIGWVVVLGSILGVMLEQSGAAATLAWAVMRLFGKKQVATGMALLGWLVGIPVFCDSGFILLSGLNQEVARRAGKSSGSLAMGLAGGLYASHTLVPPTPGPIAAAGNLGLGDALGWVLLLGIPAALLASLVAGVYAGWLGRKEPTVAEVAEKHGGSEGNPALWRALLPLLLPIVLIAAGPVAKGFGVETEGIVGLLFSPLVALTLGVGSAWVLLGKGEAGTQNKRFSEGILQAGPILALTGAGGAFGAVLKEVLPPEALSGWMEGLEPGLWTLVLAAFALGALLKTAQGSSTSALVIGSALLVPLAEAAGVGGEGALALLVVALGAGAMTVSHANDSYFWVVTQFAGLSLKQGLQRFTILTLFLGLTVLAYCILVAGLMKN